MGAITVQTAIEHWCYVAPLLVFPQTETDYNTLVEALDAVLDAGGADENHPLAALADRMGDLIAQYEAAQLPPIPATGIDALRFLMDSHHIGQADLSEVASQGVISELLCGKRELNVRQVRALSQRFNVPAQVFIG